MTSGTSPWNGSATATIDVDSTKVALLSGATFSGQVNANVVGKVTVNSAATSSTGRIIVTAPTLLGTSATCTVGAVSGTGPYTATLTVVSGSLANVTSANVTIGVIATATAGAGNFGSNPLKITAAPGTPATATTVTVSSATTFTAGAVTTVNFYLAPTATPATGDLWFW
jgi:hypothetical protein